jgi:hypothetical protein
MTSESRRPVRIANCSGYLGDRVTAAVEMLSGGPIDVLTGDWLAELTMLILERTRRRRPDGGFARPFVDQVEQVMGACLDAGIKIVANAGGLDPRGCARAVAAVAERLGLAPRIAFVTGDDLMPRIGALAEAGALRAFEDPYGPLSDVSRFITANAYLGSWGIVHALEQGADIVITGRVTDAAVVCGPAAWYHGWARDDWDRLAGAVVAAHVIECGTQATGGNYSFFQEIEELTEPGFPWVEIAADGKAVVGKHDGTGGAVTIGTITSQLLYEIGGPRYFGPDVTARFDTIELADVGPDRVAITGVRGEPPPPTLKVAMNEEPGFRNDLGVALVGLDVEAKAALVERAFWRACPVKRDELAEVETRLHGRDKVDPHSNEEATAEWWLTVKDPNPDKVGRAVSNAVAQLFLASIPGFYLLSGMPGAGRPYGVYRPATVPADCVPQTVELLGGGPAVEVTSVAPLTPAPDVVPPPERRPAGVSGARVEVALGRIVGARSGDKGGHANLGVFARTDAGWAWLDAFLDVDCLRRLLPETASLRIERHRFPNLRALNFVIAGLLGEGVASTTRADAQAKSLGEWLRARLVRVPGALVGTGWEPL